MRQRSTRAAAEHRQRMGIVKAAAGHTGRLMCVRCPTLGRAAEAVDTDERVNRSQLAGAAVDETLMQPLCRACHDWKGANPTQAAVDGWRTPGWQHRRDNPPSDI